MTEKDHRIDILSSLLTSPHREIEGLWKKHQEWSLQDPDFYTHLASWYMENGEIRDHKHLFISTLCIGELETQRPIGGLLLATLPPHEVEICLSWVKEQGKRTIPGSMKRVIEAYLREREAQPERFERALLFGHKSLKRLYASLHLRPSPLAQSLLFDKSLPAESLPGRLQAFQKAKEPEKMALFKALLEHGKLPFMVFNPLIPKEYWGDPSLAAAMIRSMSPSEVVNHLKMLAMRGLLQQPEAAEALRQKLQDARHSKRFSTLKAEKALEVLQEAGEAALAKEWEAELRSVTNQRLQNKGEITRPMAMFVDKSSSMEQAIELAKAIGAAVAPLCRASLSVAAFDSIAIPVAAPMSGDIGVWKQALKTIRAGGATSIGCCLFWLMRQKIQVAQVVLLSDGEENTKPFFWEWMVKYEAEYGPLDLIWVRLGGESTGNVGWLREGKGKHQGTLTILDVHKADAFSIPNLLPLLTGASWLDTVMDIASYPLPSPSAPPLPLSSTAS